LTTENENLKSKLLEINAQITQMTEELSNMSITNLKTQLRSIADQLKEKQQSRKHNKSNNKKVPEEYSNATAHDIKLRLECLTKEKGELMYKFSKDILIRYQTASDQMNELMKGKHAVEMDREMLFSFIETVEKEKKETLTECFNSVDSHLNSIFSTLLPGSSAKLVRVHPTDFTKGAELRVCLGGVWKMSLMELSGGQKSLLALSLILALLKVNPAPVYIFDEVDAALDLSHTRNMGRMIKTFFQESQFIVVSLQENLFQNADVLFRTSFANGTSQVVCTKNSNNNDLMIESVQNENTNEENPARQTRRRR